ncbi:MAG: 1-acyl-sn-glycerol-3-phosphate acyltransferase [Prevotellaceae bacterium]|jgi:1-acyl-sn-glycerol-3-phosphate acyltransferase|nr:1-acyl-sn-glycerol-3-phosphate acyltransferase [Prevotellaceae bacterium]
MKNTKKPYVPNVGIDYPINEPDKHILDNPPIVDLIIDENYQFVDKTLKFRIKSFLLYIFVFCFVFLLQKVRFGLKIEGTEILRKNKKQFKNGVITISNHVLRWDFLCVLRAIRPKRAFVIVWQHLLRGKDRGVVRTIQGVPLAETKATTLMFMRALDELLAKKKWVHVFPESANWHYFQPIRPFKSGAFSFAYRYKVPILPMAISYREPTGIFKLWCKKHPLLTLKIGEPLFPDFTLDRKAAIDKLLRESHASMCALAGIDNNPYTASFDDFMQQQKSPQITQINTN